MFRRSIARRSVLHGVKSRRSSTLRQDCAPAGAPFELIELLKMLDARLESQFEAISQKLDSMVGLCSMNGRDVVKCGMDDSSIQLQPAVPSVSSTAMTNHANGTERDTGVTEPGELKGILLSGATPCLVAFDGPDDPGISGFHPKLPSKDFEYNAEPQDRWSARLSSDEKSVSSVGEHVTSAGCPDEVYEVSFHDVQESSDADVSQEEKSRAKSVPNSMLQRSRVRDERLFQLVDFKERMDETRRGHIVHAIWQFLDEPESSFCAHWYSNVMQCTILLSVCVSLLQTAPDFFFDGYQAAIIDVTFDGIFTLEVLIRWLFCPHRWLFVVDAFNLVDLLAASAIPCRASIGFVIAEHNSNNPVEMYLLSVIPMFRVLKILRRFELFNLLLSAFKIAFEAIPVLMFTFTTIMLMFSSVLYMFEPRYNVDSMPQAMWLTVITMTTVGYGDITPESTAGHLIVAVLSVVSALYMAIPLGIVGNAFNTVWEDRDRLLLVQRARNRLIQRGYKAKDIPHFFQVYAGGRNDDDELPTDLLDDNEVSLDLQDFRRMIHEMQIGLSEDRMVQLFQLFDSDGGGTVEPEEFVRVLFPKAHYALYAQHVVEEAMSAEEDVEPDSPLSPKMF